MLDRGLDGRRFFRGNQQGNELDAEVTIHEVMKMKTFGELVERVAEEIEE